MTKNGQGYWGAGTTTAVSITLVLLLLGLTILVGFVGKRLSALVKENITITIELADTTTDVEVIQLQNLLLRSPFTKTAVFKGKEEIKQELISDLGTDPEEILGYNPASSCFVVNLKAEYVHPDSMRTVKKVLKGYTIIKDIAYDQSDLELVNANLSKVGMTLLALAVALMFISFTLIRNTIRLNIYAKRFTINTMQLVGATDSFIRKPFVRQIVLIGIVAAILADALITAFAYYAIKEYPEMISVIRMNDLLLIYAAVIILGILLTFFATRSAVNKYLKMKTNNLYYI
ncbi:MAG: permease-like cell division protein FtsX [Prevotella sp.]|jgi:cell division transport system permease protein|nr:permease-like cell division protein FtsX [Prevotella sp.]